MLKFELNNYLAPGIYSLSWSEISNELGWNVYRKTLIDGLKNGLIALKNCGCKMAYIDGSFVSQKARPGDFDVCYEESGMDFAKLKKDYEPLTIFANMRELQKTIYKGEFFRANDLADLLTGVNFRTFFQQIKYSFPVEYKGIISINLDTL